VATNRRGCHHLRYHGTLEALGSADSAAVLSIKAPRQCGFGPGDHPMKNCFRGSIEWIMSIASPV
jgi:hypothetical protein